MKRSKVFHSVPPDPKVEHWNSETNQWNKNWNGTPAGKAVSIKVNEVYIVSLIVLYRLLVYYYYKILILI